MSWDKFKESGAIENSDNPSTNDWIGDIDVDLIDQKMDDYDKRNSKRNFDENSIEFAFEPDDFLYAPAGYNKLTGPVEVTPTKTSSTTTNVTVYLDENGNIVDSETSTKVTVISDKIAATAIVIVNKAGTELPETGGVGTTMFYVVGGLMMLMAVVLLVTKKRMADAE